MPRAPQWSAFGVNAYWSTKADGDFGDGGAWKTGVAPSNDLLDLREEIATGKQFAWVRPEHGGISLRAIPDYSMSDGAVVDGDVADALWSNESGVCASVIAGDCGMVALASTEGHFAAIHASVASLQAGVLENTVIAFRRAGAKGIASALGPCIHPESYEYSPDALESLTKRFGANVRSETAWGTAAFDLPRAIENELNTFSIEVDRTNCIDTGTNLESYWSYRMAKDVQRMALVVWRG